MSVQIAYIRDVFDCPPIHNAIFSCLSPPDVIRFGRVCHLFHDAVSHFHSLAYNINRHLTRFFDDPVAFRSLQAETHFLISGSNALQFLDRDFYPKSDLDIFTYPDTAREVGKWLIEKEGYLFEPEPKHGGAKAKFEDVEFNEIDSQELEYYDLEWMNDLEAYVGARMADVFSFKKGDDLKVQVIRTKFCPLDSILHFHSTCVMNFITADSAYSLYPTATFEKRITFGLGPVYKERNQLAFAKYAKRGWTSILRLEPIESINVASYTLTEMRRRINDHNVWTVKLDTEGVKATSVHPPSHPQSAFALCNTWVMKRMFDSWSTTVQYGMSYGMISSPLLKESYVCAEREFATFVSEVLTAKVLEEQDRSLTLTNGSEKARSTILHGLNDSNATAIWDWYLPEIYTMYMEVLRR